MEAKDIVATLVGFVLGVLGSWIFWRFLLFMKPDVRISDVVLKGHDRLDKGQTLYRIKVFNFGSRQVIELQASARLVEKRDDRWPVKRELKLRFGGGIPTLGRKKDFGDPLLRIPPGFTFVIEGEDCLEAEMNADRRIMFMVSAKDALSGTTVVHRKVYTAADIQTGDFARGPIFERDVGSEVAEAAVAASQDAEPGAAADPAS